LMLSFCGWDLVGKDVPSRYLGMYGRASDVDMDW
jgi:hypothetical protein